MIYIYQKRYSTLWRLQMCQMCERLFVRHELFSFRHLHHHHHHHHQNHFPSPPCSSHSFPHHLIESYHHLASSSSPSPHHRHITPQLLFPLLLLLLISCLSSFCRHFVLPIILADTPSIAYLYLSPSPLRILTFTTRPKVTPES